MTIIVTRIFKAWVFLVLIVLSGLVLLPELVLVATANMICEISGIWPVYELKVSKNLFMIAEEYYA